MYQEANVLERIEDPSCRKPVPAEHDQGLKSTLDIAQRMACSSDPVLICGETGTGKSRLARWIHEHSGRCKGPFVEIPCSSINENLIESELFGHVRGAFTGASNMNLGKIAAANHGTLFLDEIGEVSSSVQNRLLHFLQEGYYYRVGGNNVEKVDVRVVAATNRNLTSFIRRGQFREDLYFRLAVLRIDMPPLRRRGQDAILLAERFLKDSGSPAGNVIRLSDNAREQIRQHTWPGNVRELRNVLKRSLVLMEPGQEVIQVLHFDELENISECESVETPLNAFGFPKPPEVNPIHGPELERVRVALIQNHGCLNKAADQLGISRYALYRKLKKIGVNKNSAITWMVRDARLDGASRP